MHRFKLFFPAALTTAVAKAGLAGLLFLSPPVSAQRPAEGVRASAPQPVADVSALDLLLRYESPRLKYRWSLAPEAALEPALVQQLRDEALKARAKQIADVAAEEALPADGRQWAYETLVKWEVVGESARILSLLGRSYEYTGGAHGMSGTRAVLWDRELNAPIQFADLFNQPETALATLRAPFCEALDRARRDKRGGELGRNFTDCLNYTDYAIALEGDEAPFHGIRIVVPPYEAGPYAEGSYEIWLEAAPLVPYLKPAYQGLFVAPAQ